MTTAAAYVLTVGRNHIIELPKEVPEGAKVAVIVMPDESVEEARRARFAATIEAIRKASRQTKTPQIADAALNALIKQARKAPRG